MAGVRFSNLTNRIGEILPKSPGIPLRENKADSGRDFQYNAWITPHLITTDCISSRDKKVKKKPAMIVKEKRAAKKLEKESQSFLVDNRLG